VTLLVDPFGSIERVDWVHLLTGFSNGLLDKPRGQLRHTVVRPDMDT
jgi:hypothetical protein